MQFKDKLILLSFFFSTYCQANDWQVNLIPGVTQVSQEIFELHMIIFWVCVAIAVVVFGIMFYIMIAHRYKPDRKPGNQHQSLKLEIIWTLIPIIILVVMAIPATQTLYKLYDKNPAEVDILITGYQWKWQYQYLDKQGNKNISFFSHLDTDRKEIENQTEKNQNYLLEVDQPLVLPTDTKIRFFVTSADVIHSWWVPAFAVKRDAIPGYVNEAWTQIDQAGIYRGQCAELCGKDHAFMPIVVKAVSPDEYQQWFKTTQRQQQAAQDISKEYGLAELMQIGEKVYQQSCLACHQANGEGLAGAFPALKGSIIATQDLQQHIEIVVNGKPGTAMAAYAKQLSLLELAAVITYERNAWGNDTGDVVQAKDIHAYLEQNKPL